MIFTPSENSEFAPENRPSSPQKQISSLQSSIFRGKHFKFPAECHQWHQHLPAAPLAYQQSHWKVWNKKGKKRANNLEGTTEKKHISALWVKFHPKRWSCFIFECYDFFLTTFFGDVLGLQLWKDFGQLEFHAEHATPEVHFLWSWEPFFGGRMVLLVVARLYPSVFISVRTPSGKWHPQGFHKLYRTVATSSNKPKSFVSVWRSFFCFRTPVSLLQKSVFALRFSYRTLGLKNLLVFDNGFATKKTFLLSMRHPGCLMTGSFYWCSLFWINENTPFRQQKKTSDDCGDSGWWSMPIFSGPGGVFVAPNIMLNSQLSSKFVQFFGKHGWLHKIHSKFKKKGNNKNT